MLRVGRDRVRAWRLRRHLLGGAARSAVDAVDIVRRVVGVQAQVSSCARDAVAVRGGSVDELEAALERRDLVRTWAVRGTLHLLPSAGPAGAADVLAVVGAARSWEKGSWQREFATAEQVAALAQAADEVLADAVLTREELISALGAVGAVGAVVPVDRLASGWGTLLKPLAWQGVLCNGPPRGARPTFTSPRTFLPGWPGMPDADDAASRVVPAYLAAHGPATPAVFDAWLLRGATPKARLRRWFAELVEDGTLGLVDVEGEVRHLRTEDADDLADAAPTPGVRLLPGFDPWILGPGTADPDVVPPEHRGLVSRAAGWIAPVVLVDGVVTGTWAEEDGDVVVSPFPGRPGPDPTALAEEVERWRLRCRPRAH